MRVPPEPMPAWQGTRPLKRWCWVGLFGEPWMFCAADVRVGPLRQRFWALWDRRSGTFKEATRIVPMGPARAVTVSAGRVSVADGGVRLEASLAAAAPPVELVSPHGRSYAWTRKTPVEAYGHITLGMKAEPASARGLVDESAGYHARNTEWEWSAGVGFCVDGRTVVWNLVRGLHDAEHGSERAVWVDGRRREVGPVRFSPGLDEVWGPGGSLLRFEQEVARSRRDNLGLVRSDYVAPLGRFEGTLPDGTELSTSEPAFGVMERHRARW